MVRQIIKIDREKCNGCGLCAAACHEGAIEIHEGKARLAREDYCDGLGDCLPACPTGAISFERREAPAYDEAAVLAAKNQKKAREEEPRHGGCPGTRMRRLASEGAEEPGDRTESSASALAQWPCQLKLIPANAPCFDGGKLLIAADCTAYAYADIHRDFMRGRVTLIGCPKLDSGDYSGKLTEIIRNNNIESVTVLRMEVPCCGGLAEAVRTALQNSGKMIPWQVVTISVEGKLRKGGFYV